MKGDLVGVEVCMHTQRWWWRISEEEVKGTVFTNQIHLEVVVEDLILIITVLREKVSSTLGYNEEEDGYISIQKIKDYYFIEGTNVRCEDGEPKDIAKNT